MVHSRPYVFSVAAGNSIGVGHFSEQSEPASLGETLSLCARELVLCVCVCVCVCVCMCVCMLLLTTTSIHLAHTSRCNMIVK